jgi:MFS family permease
MFKWLFNNFINGNPIIVCLVAIILIAAFSAMIGWPAYYFLAISLLLLIVYFCVKRKIGKNTLDSYNDLELDRIEKKNRWVMGLLCFFALFGNLISLFATLYSLKHDDNSSTTLGAMGIFQFIFIGIPYILMSLVKRKSSFWYGLMSSLIIFGLIQFLILTLMMMSKSNLLSCHTSYNYKFYKDIWFVAGPLFIIPIILMLDSIGKAFGFAFKDNTTIIGWPLILGSY